MPDITSVGEDQSIVAQGGRAQLVVPAAIHGLGTTIAGNGNVTSNILPSTGLTSIALGVTSSQAGQVTIQQYLDLQATIPAAPVLTGTLTAATPLFLQSNPLVVFRSFIVTITNTSGSLATLTKLAIVQQA